MCCLGAGRILPLLPKSSGSGHWIHALDFDRLVRMLSLHPARMEQKACMRSILQHSMQLKSHCFSLSTTAAEMRTAHLNLWPQFVARMVVCCSLSPRPSGQRGVDQRPAPSGVDLCMLFVGLDEYLPCHNWKRTATILQYCHLGLYMLVPLRAACVAARCLITGTIVSCSSRSMSRSTTTAYDQPPLPPISSYSISVIPCLDRHSRPVWKSAKRLESQVSKRQTTGPRNPVP